MKHFIIAAGLAAGILLPDSVCAEDIRKSTRAPVIDGEMDDVWQMAEWRPLNHHITGSMPDGEDFSGRYKLLWDQDHLYILAEITDDVLFDGHPDPREAYWDDDSLEVFVDEDASGGDHLHNHNAFAYHIALDGHVADMGAQLEDGKAEILLLDDHAKSRWKRSESRPQAVLWEVAITLFDDTFDPASNANEPVKLKPGKEIGFMLAYCDNDGSNEREHFIGSHAIDPVDGDKNLGYITADVFGRFTLVP